MQQSCSACPIDDYFPDYQFGCVQIILLNDSFAQESGLRRFFCCPFMV